MKTYTPKSPFYNYGASPIVVHDDDRIYELDFAGGKAYHSPDGFSWGYHGSGPAELARAILADLTGTIPAPHVYQAFKAVFIAPLPRNSTDWTLAEEPIRDWLKEREA